MYYGPAFIIGGATLLSLASPGLVWLGIVFIKLGIIGFELHLLKEAQRVGWIDTEKEIIGF